MTITNLTTGRVSVGVYTYVCFQLFLPFEMVKELKLLTEAPSLTARPSLHLQTNYCQTTKKIREMV